MEAIISLLFLLVPLVVCGLIIGRYNEKRHFKNIEEREDAYQNFLVTQLKSFPSAVASPPAAPSAVIAEVVIASDYLKTFLSGWRKIFGGEMKSFTTMQDRAKREVVLRLIEQAHQQGFNAVCNVRIDGVDIGSNSGRRQSPMAAVIGSATAYHASHDTTAPTAPAMA